MPFGLTPPRDPWTDVLLVAGGVALGLALAMALHRLPQTPITTTESAEPGKE